MRSRHAGLFVVLTAGTLALACPATNAAVVTGLSGHSVSVYANPFDPNLDYNANESTFAYGDPTTGLPGSWNVNSTSPLSHAVDRRDGRNYPNDHTGAWIYNNANTSGPPAFMQFQAPEVFEVGTIITAHSLATSIESLITNQTPYDIRFSTGSPGTTADAWSGITPKASGPGIADTHPITVTTLDEAFTADTMRISFAASTVLSTGSESDAMMQEVVLLPDRLYQIATTVTGFSADSTGRGGAGINDGIGGAYDGGTFGFWYDIRSTVPPSEKFVELTLTDGPDGIAAIVFFGDTFGGQALNIRADGQLVASVTFDPTANLGEVLPIRFDNPIKASVLRFEWTADNADNWVGMREIVVLGIPEPATAALLIPAIGLFVRRRGRAHAKAQRR